MKKQVSKRTGKRSACPAFLFQKAYLIAAVICWAIALIALVLLVYGCASPEVKIAYDAEWQVRKLARQVVDAPWESQIDKVHAGKKFRANCQTYALTVADLLIEYGADPADVWIVIAKVPLSGIQLWDFGKGYLRLGTMTHMMVYYKGYIINNLKPHVAKPESLGYDWLHMRPHGRVNNWERIDFAKLGGAL